MFGQRYIIIYNIIFPWFGEIKLERVALLAGWLGTVVVKFHGKI